MTHYCKEGGGHSHDFRGCKLLHQPGRKMYGDHWIFKSYLVWWHVPYERLNLMVICVYTLLVFVDDFVSFLHVFVCAANGGMTLTQSFFNQRFFMFEIKKTTQKSVFSHWHCHPNLFLNILCIFYAVIPSLKQHLMFVPSYCWLENHR